jgi:exodeoxyribonuclease V alpha subunit
MNGDDTLPSATIPHQNQLEKLSGVVERITYHNEQSGWSVLKVRSFKDPARLSTVLIHQVQVFAGATMEFWGSWTHHSQHGEQFKALRSVEKKPASAAALEKYLGSGLIRGVGPATAKKIVQHFNERTLEVFEDSIEELTHVPGIADKKLEKIKHSWQEHRSIRDVMIFLQGHGISTLFATKIYKTYGDQSIPLVSENPYRLAHDIYGIGFFSADRIALAMGFAKNGEARIEAGIKQVLSASRDEGHCFLSQDQIITNTLQLLNESIDPVRLLAVLEKLRASQQVRVRKLWLEDLSLEQDCYYAKSLYQDEETTAQRITTLLKKPRSVDETRIKTWVDKYCEQKNIQLSEEQYQVVCQIPQKSFAILTGGPGCGKTTCTEVLVKLLLAMKLRVTLAAPTGRAAQRMSEVIGLEAKTIHRLLEWAPQGGGFKFNEDEPLDTDFLILDEASMLDVSLAASLLKATPNECQVLFIGDPDQLPAVGAGNVLSDLLQSQSVPRFRLTQVFRQAQASSIIRFAHEINKGVTPKITSPIQDPEASASGVDCLFVDADEANQEQTRFIRKIHHEVSQLQEGQEGPLLQLKDQWLGRLQKTDSGVEWDRLYRPEVTEDSEVRAPTVSIPEKFKNVDLSRLANAQSEVEQLMSVLKSVHPWSTVKFGMSAVDTLLRLYTKSVPQWMGRKPEVQVLCPQVRGSMGTMNLNKELQNLSNPVSENKKQIQMGEKIFRQGDRVIQTRNNYNLGVFNGDIGHIQSVDLSDLSCTVLFSGGTAREVVFNKEDMSELQLAYAITIHKSQGSEFEVVILPVLGQHFNMLYRNLIYTGLTRAKKLALFVGSRKALAVAVGQVDNRKRQTALSHLVDFSS